MARKKYPFFGGNVSDDELDIDSVVEEFRTVREIDDMPQTSEPPADETVYDDMPADEVFVSEATVDTAKTTETITEEEPTTEAVADEAVTDDALSEEYTSQEEPDESLFVLPTVEQIVEPIASGTADALAAVPKAKPAPVEDELEDDVAVAAAPTANPETDTTPKADSNAPKRNGFMRFLGAIVPHIGDDAFDVVRKCIMIAGILVFVGAATYLVDDLILIPMQNTVLAESLQSQYSPDAEPVLNEDEMNYPYPEGMDSAFKKLYYQNNDVRGWISYHTTDGTTFSIDYPIVQSDDNDYYLYHDFNFTYNKNGTLFYDYANDLDSADAFNHNTIIYGHNMASGQMFAGLNRLLDGVDYARVAPTFTMNTLYEKAEYKVFAVMVINNDIADGNPFGYLRTDFIDNVDFATFLSEILARSLYVYGDVDLRPDDEIVTLSTCSEFSDVHFNDGRTVVVARKVREGESPTTDVSQITVNDDVIMPYGWYANQELEPHPYYIDANYVIQPLDTLMAYMATSTAPSNASAASTSFTLTEINGTFVLDPLLTSTLPTTTTTAPIVTETTTTQAYMQSIYIDYTPKLYKVGDSFNYDATRIMARYSDGSTSRIPTHYCAITGFNSSRPGTYYVTVHYGSLRTSFFVTVKAATTQSIETEPPTTTTLTPPEVTTTTGSEPVVTDPTVPETEITVALTDE